VNIKKIRNTTENINAERILNTGEIPVFRHLPNFFILFLICGFINISSAQDSIPETIKKSFAAKYKNAEGPEWKKENDIYEVNFNIEKIFCNSYFKTNGKWIETRYSISVSKIPSEIINDIKKRFPVHTIYNCSKIETEEGKIFYNLTAEGKSETHYLKYSEKGELIENISDDFLSEDISTDSIKENIETDK